jgi:hypothetical protein
MAFALVAGTPGDTGASNIASGAAGTILGANSTVGYAVLAAISVNSASAGAITGITSSIGTFVKLGAFAPPSGGTYETEVWICWSATGAATTITVTTTGAVAWTAQGTEWSGGLTSAVVTSASGSGTAPSIACSPGVAGNVVAAIVSMGTAALTSGPGGAWTVYNAGKWKPTGYADVAWQVTTSPAAVTATWASNSSTWLCVGVVLGAQGNLLPFG